MAEADAAGHELDLHFPVTWRRLGGVLFSSIDFTSIEYD